MPHGSVLDGRLMKNIITRSSNLDLVMPSGLCKTNGRLNAYKVVNSWQICTGGCMSNEQMCKANCSNECDYLLQDPMCQQNPWACTSLYGNCIYNCEHSCTYVYGTNCYKGCGY